MVYNVELVIGNNVVIDMDLILSDCDGVLLDWQFGFNVWMERQGYKKVSSVDYGIDKCYNIPKSLSKQLIKQFNESAACGYLPPLRDAAEWVRKLYEEKGVRIRVITSLSLEPYAVKLREENLKRIFGEAIESVICLDTGADKDEALAPYANSGMFWIEDKPANAELGAQLGLAAFLMQHTHNTDYDSDDVCVISTWKEIYKYV
jgi:hypothetical protein